MYLARLLNSFIAASGFDSSKLPCCIVAIASSNLVLVASRVYEAAVPIVAIVARLRIGNFASANTSAIFSLIRDHRGLLSSPFCVVLVVLLGLRQRRTTCSNQ